MNMDNNNAQADDATGVVWGTPGTVATAGLRGAIFRLPELAPYIRKIASRGAS